MESAVLGHISLWVAGVLIVDHLIFLMLGKWKGYLKAMWALEVLQVRSHGLAASGAANARKQIARAQPMPHDKAISIHI